ncbi:hypothetical protein [Chryseobacterium sp. StRB126]|nr:hypothetical protein [Chryseobacterium sp. StRB126]
MKKFLTQYRNINDLYAGQNIYAPSWNEAQIIADKRGLGEKVIGYL